MRILKGAQIESRGRTDAQRPAIVLCEITSRQVILQPVDHVVEQVSEPAVSPVRRKDLHPDRERSIVDFLLWR